MQKVLKLFQNVFLACPKNDWIVLNNTCYKFQNKTSNFNDARHFCTNLSSKIFEPRNNLTDENVYKFAKQFMNLNHGAWIGVVTNQTEDWRGNISSFVEKILMLVFRKCIFILFRDML